MSIQEYLDLWKDFDNNLESIIEYNKELTSKYPWLIPRNRWTDKIPEDYDYTYTELEDLPRGWRIAFGEEMCEEIQADLEKYDYVDKYRILQIKEKYGSARIYDAGAPMEVHNIIDKYERLSEKICINCGKPATKVSRGWISYYCDECADRLSHGKCLIKFDKIEK